MRSRHSPRGGCPADAVADLEAHARQCSACSELLTAALGAIHGATARPAGAVTRAVSRGASIGRYLVLDHLGSGGMGDVFAAYDPELDRKIALKLLRAEGEARGERGRGRLLREAKAIAKLSHPNVVVVHDAGTYDDRVFVAMEFVEGQTLAAWLAERPRAAKEILAVFAAGGARSGRRTCRGPGASRLQAPERHGWRGRQGAGHGLRSRASDCGRTRLSGDGGAGRGGARPSAATRR